MASIARDAGTGEQQKQLLFLPVLAETKEKNEKNGLSIQIVNKFALGKAFKYSQVSGRNLTETETI